TEDVAQLQIVNSGVKAQLFSYLAKDGVLWLFSRIDRSANFAPCTWLEHSVGALHKQQSSCVASQQNNGCDTIRSPDSGSCKLSRVCCPVINQMSNRFF